MKPKELHLYYADFAEHSPDTLEFVQALMVLANHNFENVKTTITQNSVLSFFEQAKMIPHPISSPCSRLLKIEPMMAYNSAHGVEVDLIGYVRTEQRRINRMEDRAKPDMFLSKAFPISQFDDEWCFTIVKEMLGWYPAIYDLKWKDKDFIAYVLQNLLRFNDAVQRKLKNKIGKDKRVFKHNNCLPCKNMHIDDMLAIEYFYPAYMAKATALGERLKGYWGRNADDYYTTFGKEDYEPEQCEACSFD